MRRRPRPANEPPPDRGSGSQTKSRGTAPKSLPPAPQLASFHAPQSGSESTAAGDTSVRKYDASNDSEEEGVSGGYYDLEIEEKDEEEVEFPDVVRVAQWVEEELMGSEEDDDVKGPSTSGKPELQLKSLQTDLSSLPLGALRRAQHALAQAKPDSDEEDHDTSRSSGSGYEDIPWDDPHPSLKGKEKAKPGLNVNSRKDICKRSSKHAPIEVTSKRPVTRRRTVVEVRTIQARDPRFLPTAGEFSSPKFLSQYGFLVDMHSNELKTLRDSLRRARRQLVYSPRDLREERQREVNRIELAVKRVESTVDKDRREKVENEALRKATRDERERRKQGKAGWWMKNSDKKELLMRAKYDALAAAGGTGAVKKAIEKKQKKIGQKEKKSRPFARGRGGQEGQAQAPRKRARGSHGRDESGKRRKVG